MSCSRCCESSDDISTLLRDWETVNTDIISEANGIYTYATQNPGGYELKLGQDMVRLGKIQQDLETIYDKINTWNAKRNKPICGLDRHKIKTFTSFALTVGTGLAGAGKEIGDPERCGGNSIKSINWTSAGFQVAFIVLSAATFYFGKTTVEQQKLDNQVKCVLNPSALILIRAIKKVYEDFQNGLVHVLRSPVATLPKRSQTNLARAPFSLEEKSPESDHLSQRQSGIEEEVKERRISIQPSPPTGSVSQDETLIAKLHALEQKKQEALREAMKEYATVSMKSEITMTTPVRLPAPRILSLGSHSHSPVQSDISELRNVDSPPLLPSQQEDLAAVSFAPSLLSETNLDHGEKTEV